jgi:hypothetical protein
VRNVLSTVTDNGSLVLRIIFVVVVMGFRRGVLGETVRMVANGLVRRKHPTTPQFVSDRVVAAGRGPE